MAENVPVLPDWHVTLNRDMFNIYDHTIDEDQLIEHTDIMKTTFWVSKVI